jgi:homoaconitate hydratase
MVIAASFSQTYLRNAFNNAFICLESPALADAVRTAHADEAADGARTIPTDPVTVDFARSEARWRDRTYPVSPLGPAAQELVLAGGLEALTRRRLRL